MEFPNLFCLIEVESVLYADFSMIFWRNGLEECLQLLQQHVDHVLHHILLLFGTACDTSGARRGLKVTVRQLRAGTI